MNDLPTDDDPDPNVRHDIGGWISGPCLDEPLPGPLTPYAARWAIEVHPAGLAVWTATRVRGTETRCIVAPGAAELAAKLEAAEAEDAASGRPPRD